MIVGLLATYIRNQDLTVVKSVDKPLLWGLFYFSDGSTI
jgi:hypothetical protein